MYSSAPCASPAQIAANQANAQLSTGPLTAATKAISSRNNLRHGFRSQSVLLPGDDPADYDALLAELTTHFLAPGLPAEISELRFIREMADAEWRLRRVRHYIEDAITRRIAALAPDHPGAEPVTLQSLAVETLAETGTSYSTWLRYETKFERQYERAYKAWRDYHRHGYVDDHVNDILDLRPSDAPDAASAHQPVSAQPVLAQPVPAPPAPAKLASNVQNRSTLTPGCPQTPPQTPRNAPCPCGSREKFKRCCGKTAPPVLGAAA